MSASSSVGQRFSQLIQQLGMSKNAFAMSLDKTATVIQHLVDERNKPGFDLMNKVFEVYPNVSVDWLVRGHGPMLRDSHDAPVAPVTSPAPALVAAAPPRVSPATPVFPEPLFTVSVASQPSPEATVPPAAPLGVAPPAATTGMPPVAPSQPIPAPVMVEALPEPSPLVPPPAPMPAAAATPPAAPDAAYLTAALHAQYLQHQLALAEQRNQHLVEQQQLMQQMLTMLQSR